MALGKTAEKQLFGLFRDACKQLTAALRWDIGSIGMPVERTPFFKSKQWGIALQDQIIGDGLNLLIPIFSR